MNANAKVSDVSSVVTASQFLPEQMVAYRAKCALGHEIYTNRITVDLTAHQGGELWCEVDFYEECEAIETTRDEPGEPAQYAVASVRPYVFTKNAHGYSSGIAYLPTPAWLAELIHDLIDTGRLEPDL